MRPRDDQRHRNGPGRQAFTPEPEWPEVTGMADTPWWQRGIFYQVYPRSFQDSDGDGIGDLDGIRRRLDYLTWLGCDAIWISPIYPSPMADFGYDIADYCGIDPVFGTLETFDHLVAETHARGLKLILDFVPNHTSDQHPWFRESRSSRASPRRDWYIWRDPAPAGGPPNNWLANFGGSAWTLDQASGQYYYHAFLEQQPDLNWRNPAVRAAMMDTLRFWLDRGVDGFRVDVIWLLIKDDQFRDNPPNPNWHPHQPDIERLLQVYTADRPETQTVIGEMRAVLDAYPDRVLIGEIYLPVERLVAYYGNNLGGAQLPFNFQLIFTTWNAAAIARMIEHYEAALPPGGWPNWVLGNHDQKRIATRIGAAGARLAAMLLLTLRGTPTLYYGDELGLRNVLIPPDRAQDPWERNEPGLGRDPARTPMPWDASGQGGFTAGTPWLPLNDDYRSRNVAALAADAASILTLYRRLIALRREHSALHAGAYLPLDTTDEVLAYERRDANKRLLVLLNFSSEPRRTTHTDRPARVLLSTFLDRPAEIVAGELILRGSEGVLLAIDP